MKKLMALALAFPLSACVVSPDYYEYEGPKHEPAEESVVYFNDKDGVIIDALDDKILANQYLTLNGGSAAVRVLHLMPGQHSLRLVAGRGGYGPARTTLSREFEAGSRHHLTTLIEGNHLEIVFLDEQGNPERQDAYRYFIR